MHESFKLSAVHLTRTSVTRRTARLTNPPIGGKVNVSSLASG